MLPKSRWLVCKRCVVHVVRNEHDYHWSGFTNNASIQFEPDRVQYIPKINHASTFAQWLLKKRIDHVTMFDVFGWLECIVSVGMRRVQQHQQHIINNDVPTRQRGFAYTWYGTSQQPLSRMMPTCSLYMTYMRTSLLTRTGWEMSWITHICSTQPVVY